MIDLESLHVQRKSLADWHAASRPPPSLHVRSYGRLAASRPPPNLRAAGAPRRANKPAQQEITCIQKAKITCRFNQFTSFDWLTSQTPYLPLRPSRPRICRFAPRVPVFLVAMAVVFPEALPFPLIGPFDGPRNRSRHMPITREMLEELQPIVLPISGWMFLFKQDLHPYGGELQFAKDQDWRDGPTIYKYKLSGQSL